MRASEFITEAAKPTDQDTIDLVKMLWDEGKGNNAIAKDLGVSTITVKNILNRYYKSRTGKKLDLAYALTDDDKNDIVTRFLNNDAMNDIGRDYALTHNTISNILKSNLGVDRFNKEIENRKNSYGNFISHKITPEMLVKIKELYVAGKTMTDISNYFDNIIGPSSANRAMQRQPDYAELRAKREENTRKVKHSPVATTAIHRPGTIGNQRSKGPQSRHTSGVNWPKYG